MAFVSFGLDDFVQGGLLSDVDVTFTNARFEMFDYNGQQEPQCALAIDLIPKGEDEPRTQYWTVGGKDTDLRPSDDGKRLVSDSGVTLKKGSNFHIFMTELASHGFDVKAGVQDISALDGLKAHVIRVPIKGRNAGGDGGKEVLVVSHIHWDEMKGGKGSAKPAAGKASGTAAPAASAAEANAAEFSDDAKEKALEILTEVAETLSEDETIDLTKLKVAASKLALKKKYKNQPEITKVITNAAWLEESAPAASLIYDGAKTLTKVG